MHEICTKYELFSYKICIKYGQNWDLFGSKILPFWPQKYTKKGPIWNLFGSKNPYNMHTLCIFYAPKIHIKCLQNVNIFSNFGLKNIPKRDQYGILALSPLKAPLLFIYSTKEMTKRINQAIVTISTNISQSPCFSILGSLK